MSQPPDYPGTPADPYGSNPPPGYNAPPPPPGYNAPPPPPPPPGYGQPGGQPGGQGGYGAPPPPPPPPGPGYGAPQAGYPQPGYGGQPGGPGPVPFSIGDAVSWAWNKFTQNPAPLAISALIYMIVNGVLGGVQYAASAMNTTTSVYDPNTGSYSVHAGLGTGALLMSSIVSLVSAAVAIYQHASFASGTLDIADGKPVEIGTFFKPRNLGPVILTALLVGVGVVIGLVLCIVPGLIFAVLAMFSIQYVIDRSLSPIDAIKASIATVRANVGPALLCVLVLIAAGVASAITCGLGSVVTIPIGALVLTYTYRKLSGGQVVELAQPGYPQGPPPGIPPGPPPQYS